MRILVAFFVSVALLAGDPFDPQRDLPGWDDCYLSDYQDLYRLAPFEERQGKRLTSDELASVRKQWEEEKSRVAKEIQRIKSDPKARFAWDLGKDAKRDPFFGKVTLAPPYVGRDYVVFVQEPPKPQKNYAKMLDGQYGPYLDALASWFDENYAKPLGLARRREIPAIALFILSSRGAYDDYARSKPAGITPSDSELAHYDLRRRFAVTFEPGTASEHVSEQELRHRVLHEATHALTDAYSSKGAASIQGLWLVEGLAEFLSSHDGKLHDKTLVFGVLDKSLLRTCDELRRVQPFGDILFPPVEDLVAVKALPDAVQLAEKRAKAHGYPLTDELAEASVGMFYAASTLFVRFLHEGEGGRHRAGFLRYAAAELAGEGGGAAFARTFGVASPGLLETSFRAYVDTLIKEKLGARDAKSSKPESPSVTPAPAAKLEIRPATPQAVTGLLMRRARAGELHAARDAASAAGADADDVQFLQALAKLSDDLLDASRKEGKDLPVKGKKGGVGKVKEFGPAEIVLVDYKGKEVRVSRTEFGPDQVVDRIRSKSLPLGDPKTIASTLVLIGRPLDTAIKVATPAAADVVKKRAERWAALDREADARERIDRLAPLLEKIPDSPDAALADVTALLGPLTSTLESTQNRDAILALGARLLEKAFDRSDAILSTFHGQTKRLPDSSLEITYPLAKLEELQDFVTDEKYASQFAIRDDEEKGTKPAMGKWVLASGKLESRGLASLFHAARFSGPSSIQFGLVVGGGVDDRNSPALFGAGLCDDGNGSFCLLGSLEQLFVMNSDKGRFRFPDLKDSGRAIYLGRKYEIILKHAGSQFTVSVDGKETSHAPDEDVTSGRAFLVAVGEMHFTVSGLVIRGMLDPAFVAERRAAWIAERRAAWEKKQ